jgi:enterochelin esterase-like enzyme
MKKNNGKKRIFSFFIGFIVVLFIQIPIYNVFSQTEKGTPGTNLQFNSYGDFKTKLINICNNGDSKELDIFWNELKRSNQIPFRFKDSAAFLYRGEAEKVGFQGDFNGWGNQKQVKIIAEKLGKSDVWILEHSFPTNARIDYKVVLNEKDWILDANNPNQQMSGFGPNSELRMPDWKYPEETIRRKDLPRGEFLQNDSIVSKLLEYKIYYRVYLPFNYQEVSKLPVIYVTDGHEYSDDEKGSMVIVLDNLIAKKKIKPVIAVFIDPREPGKLSNNRRQAEYVMNENFVNFVCDELVPVVDKKYKTNPKRDDRAILGTSFGGIVATYFGVIRPEVFKLLAIQSPAYWAGQKLYNLYKDTKDLDLKMFISAGTMFDGEVLTRKVKSDFEKAGYKIYYKEVPEGHSWGNWRALLNEMLIFFWGI